MTSQVEIIGSGSAEKLSLFIEKYEVKHLFIVRGKNAYHTSGAKNAIDRIILKHSLLFTEFSDFSINPKIEDVEKGLALLRNAQSEMIVAIGGGSVIDMAKLIRFFYAYEGSIDKNTYKLTRKHIPLVALPTTAGTGSEATHFAVVYQHQIKYSVAHLAILPEVAIVDASFTYQTPPYLTACAGFDALAQAIESYWNVFSTSESKEFAVQAIDLLWEHLPKAVLRNTLESRDFVSRASFYAGKSINITKTTAPHAFSYPFTTYYNFPHGHAVALTFPFFMQFNYVENEKQWNGTQELHIHHQKMDNLYQRLGFKNPTDASLGMRKFIQHIGLSFQLPNSFDADVIARNVNAARVANNPAKIFPQDIIQVINSIQE